MKRKPFLILALTFAGALVLEAEGIISPDVAALVTGNVFEVVVHKPTEDPLTYAEPLPLDLLPFAERNDAYISIGTAFALDDGRFVSAGHVFSPQARTLWTGYSLRDGAGKVYPVGKVLAYSHWRDYIVFEVHGLKVPGLKTAKSPLINSRVFAAGNALGEGVVMREGLLTSLTPEEWKGAWNWIRFSAPASPGNSGGPLIDSQGSVLGIVLRKSENENLNYALPIAEAAADSSAHFDIRYTYGIPNITKTVRDELHRDIPLPMELSELRALLSGYYEDAVRKAASRVVDENRPDLFPASAKSASVLGDSRYVALPSFLTQQSDDTWKIDTVAKTERAQVGADGRLTWGEFLGYSLIDYVKSSDQTVTGLCGDPRLLFDSILQGFPLYRKVAEKSIRITSFGAPSDTRFFVDSWGRKWFVAVWTMALYDSAFLLVYLPTPHGAYCLYRGAPFSRIGFLENDARIMSDFAFLSYSGSLRDWADFLAVPDILPKAFKAWHLSYEAGKSVSVDTPRVSFTQDSRTVEIGEKSQVLVQTGYFRQGDTVVWDAGGLIFSETPALKSYFALLKTTRPAESADETIKTSWKALLSSSYPFNDTEVRAGSTTSVCSVPHAMDAHGTREPDFKYWVLGYFQESSGSQKLVARTNAICRGFTVHEGELALSVGREEGESKGPGMARINGRTIFEAIQAGDRTTLTAFILAKKDLNLVDGRGNTPLVAALVAKHAEMSADLVNAGASVSGRAPDGMTPLMLSMDVLFGDLPQRLIDRGADRSAVSAQGKTAFGEALRCGRDELAAALVRSDSIPLQRDTRGWTPLLAALRYQAAKTVAELLPRTKDFAAETNDGWNALHLAARFMPELVSQIARRSRSAVNSRTNEGATALSLAAQYDEVDQLRELLKDGADASLANPAGWTPLMWALRYGSPDNARCLMLVPAALSGVNRDGWQPLHFAARYQPALLVELIDALEKAGAHPDLKAVTKAGYSPLHLAVIAHSADAVTWLLAQGAGGSTRTADGKTALDLATEEDDAALMQLLKRSN